MVVQHLLKMLNFEIITFKCIQSARFLVRGELVEP